MIVKEIIGIILLSITLQVIAADNNDGKSGVNNHEFQNKQSKHFQNSKNIYGEKFKDTTLKFQKDYDTVGINKYAEHDPKLFSDDSHNMKINEIDSKEYVDKYNKYGKAHMIAKTNIIYPVKNKTAYHKKRALENEKHHEGSEKPGNLLHDINVNYINNNKEISGDSELIAENAVQKNKENYQENYQNGNELYMKRYKKDFYQNLNKINLTNPPPPNDTVLMARYIVHTVDWAALATLSGRSPTKGSPFVCVKATSDGMRNASSGIPFFYMSPMDLCTQDLQKDNRVSVLVSLSETEYCKNQNLDPQDPRCAKLTLSGKIKKIKSGSDEEKFAKNALFSRHPVMESWPKDHNWYFTKLKIGQIILLDQFGGATYIRVKDYLNGKVMEPDLKKK